MIPWRGNGRKVEQLNIQFFQSYDLEKIPKWINIDIKDVVRLKSKLLEKIRKPGSFNINALSVNLGVARSTVEGALQYLVNLVDLVMTGQPIGACQGGMLPTSCVGYFIINQGRGGTIYHSSEIEDKGKSVYLLTINCRNYRERKKPIKVN